MAEQHIDTEELLKCRADCLRMYRTSGFGGALHDFVDGAVPEMVAEIERLRAENQRLRDEADKYRKSSFANGHVVLESGVTPGIDIHCRCEDCRSVARALDSAGWLEDIPHDRRWWEQESTKDAAHD